VACYKVNFDFFTFLRRIFTSGPLKQGTPEE